MSSGLEDRFQTLHEIVRAARANLAPGPWDYLVGGTETETTVRRNRQALDSVAFRPRVLRDVSRVDVTGTVVRRARPPARHARPDRVDRIVHARRRRHGGEGRRPVRRPADAELRLQSRARGDGRGRRHAPHLPALRPRRRRRRGRLGAPRAGPRLPRLLPHGGQRVLQPARARPGAPVRQALAGRRDGPRVPARRSRGTRSSASRTSTPTSRSSSRASRTAEDADIACRHGVEVVYVSNHGGRQLDHGRGSLAVLPEVVRAVGGRARVWVDGGFVRGTDIVKAIALGAEVVGLGRIACMGLAAAGDSGLVRVLELLEEEVRLCLGLLGVTRLRRARRELPLRRDARRPAVRRERLPAPRPRRRPALTPPRLLGR